MSFIKFSAILILSLSSGAVMAASEQKEEKISTEKKEALSDKQREMKTTPSKGAEKAPPTRKGTEPKQKANPLPSTGKGKVKSTPKAGGHPQSPPKLTRSTPPPPPPSSNILMTQQDIAKAVAAADKGKGKIIPFFGFYNKGSIGRHMPPSSGNGFWYLSNYYESQPSYPVAVQINYKGTVYTFSATENAYQAGKCLISGVVTQDADIQKFVKASPNDAKNLANKEFKCGTLSGTQMSALMTNLVGQKFAGPLGAKLRAETGLTTLMEGNNWGDSYWGCPFDGTQYTQNCASNLGNTLEGVRANGGNPGPFMIK